MRFFRPAAAAACVFMLAGPAAASSLYIENNGIARHYTDAELDFFVQTTGRESISVSFHSPNFGVSGDLTFAAPRRSVLRPGRYVDAERAAFRVGRAPGVDATFGGGGCNEVWGSFEIRQITYAVDGTLLALDASLSRACWEGGSPLVATIKWNATPLSYTYKSTSGDPLGLGATRKFLTDQSTLALSGTGAGIDYAASGDREDWLVQMRPPTGSQLAIGSYTTASAAGAGVAGLVVSGEGRTCSTSTGTLKIVDLRKNAAGAITGLNAIFTVSCDGNPPYTGTIRHHR
jgi:hypothetical protein